MAELKNYLFLEQRLAIAREALNHHTLAFADVLPENERLCFNQFVHDIINVLDGDPFGDARERLRNMVRR